MPWRSRYWRREIESLSWEAYCARDGAIPEPDRQKICEAKMAGVGRIRLREEYGDKYSLYQIKLLLVAFRNRAPEQKEEYGYNITRI